MSWVRNNVSKAISQQRVFYAAPSKYQPQIPSERPGQSKVENSPQKSFEKPLQKESQTGQSKVENSPQKSFEKPLQKESQTAQVITKSEPYSCMKHIDAILYINLEHRKDRLEHIRNEIKKINPDLSKAYRIDAVKNNNGALGCSLSHIKALKLIISNPSWNNVMILEDDFTFISNNSTEINDRLNYFFNNVKEFDNLLLGTGNTDYKDEESDYPLIRRVLSSQTTSGYVISRKNIFTVLANFIKSSKLMEQENKSEYALDQYWKQLMPLGKWYTFEKRVGYQYPSFSDVEKRLCDYKC